MAEGLATEIAGMFASADGPYLSRSLKGRDNMAIRRSNFLPCLRGRPGEHPEPLDRYSPSGELLSPWEIPVDRELALHLDPGRGDGAAYVPVRWGLIPDAATQALTELICVRRPRDMVVAPGGIRRVRGTDVYCPTQVLAAGDHGIALWVDDLPFDRVTGVLAYRDIRMVEHASGDESAHLTVIGATRRFTLHYRRRSRPSRGPQLEDLLLRIRLRTAGLSNDVAQYGDERCEVGSAPALVGPGASRVVLCLRAPMRSRWTPWKRAGQGAWRAVVLTDHELVLLRTSAARSAPDGGEDILAVPRSHLRGLSVAGASLYVDAGATHMVTLGASFARRVVKEFSEMVNESSPLAQPVVTQKGTDGVFR